MSVSSLFVALYSIILTKQTIYINVFPRVKPLIFLSDFIQYQIVDVVQ